MASRCAAAGWRVAIVDDQPPGGTCALRGCDPKKILVGAAGVADDALRMASHGLGGHLEVDWPALMRFKRSFTDPVPDKQRSGFSKKGIEFLPGHAEFAGPRTLRVANRELSAPKIVIASGASPARLGIDGEDHVTDSTTFLELDALPSRIAFIGAGYISFEFAHIVQRAGASATILGRGAPLRQFDRDVVHRLVTHSRESGIDLQTDADVTGVERVGDTFQVHFRSGNTERNVVADLVVHGGGRTPNTAGLNLKSANVEVDNRGAVRVNEFLQSVSNSAVYASGDVALPEGSIPLTPVGGHEAAVVAHNLLHGNTRSPDYRAIPSVVFTNPALATVGLTESAARERGIPVAVKTADTHEWYSSRRLRHPASMFKTLVHRESDQIIGAHLLGPHAEEVINIFALAMRNNIPASELRHMIFAYPTNASDLPYML